VLSRSQAAEFLLVVRHCLTHSRQAIASLSVPYLCFVGRQCNAELLGTDADEDDLCPTCLEVYTNGEWLAGLQWNLERSKVGEGSKGRLLAAAVSRRRWMP
jgi:hypothetical protein